MREESFYAVLLAGWLALGVVAFFSLLYRTAPYGRFARPGWGPAIAPRLAWLLMESPAAVLFTALYLVGTGTGRVSLAFLLIWNIHYVYRGFVYPWLKRSRRGVPVSIVAAAVGFHVVNVYLQARWLFHLAPRYSADWLVDPRFLGGATVMAVGLAITVRSDLILRSLRPPGGHDYGIPRGGMFRWVSCPNYLGELVEWCGWALLTWSLAGVAFALWTAANLIPRAMAYHRWYRDQFADYPPDRRAIIPFLL